MTNDEWTGEPGCFAQLPDSDRIAMLHRAIANYLPPNWEGVLSLTVQDGVITNHEEHRSVPTSASRRDAE